MATGVSVVRTRRSHAVLHLQVLHGELDVAEATPPDLEVVPPRALATELALHAHAHVDGARSWEARLARTRRRARCA